VEALKQGIKDAWGSLVDMWKQKLADLADMLPWSEPKDPRSPLRNLSESGRSLVENFTAGMDFDQLQAALRNQLAAVARNVEGAGIGDMIVNQNIEGGLNFPNVKDERDALGVRVGIDRQALTAGMMARTRA